MFGIAGMRTSALNLPHQPRINRFAREFRVVLQRIEDMLLAYQIDRSDLSSDYFSVNFYSSVREGEQADLEHSRSEQARARRPANRASQWRDSR